MPTAAAGSPRAVLADLERAAAAMGCRRAVLETGTRQPEAISLYRGAGYSPIPPFGVYREHAGCRCFAKPLVPAVTPAEVAAGHG